MNANNLQKTQTKSYNFIGIPIYIILLIVLMVILTIINIRTTHKAYYDWWDGNDGKKYSKFFNLTNALLSRENIVLYWLSYLFGNLQSNLGIEQIKFLFEYVLIQAIFVEEDGTETGFVLPRHVTKDITFKIGDNNTFDNWILTQKFGDKQITTDVFLDYDVLGSGSNVTFSKKNNGLYPSPYQSEYWKYKFTEWGIPLTCYKASQSGMNYMTLTDDMRRAWFDSGKRDNFFAKYNIMPDCPAIIAFLNGKYNDPDAGIVLDAICLQRLIGGVVEDNVGGWVGALEGLGNNNLDKYATYFYTEYAAKLPKPTPTGTSKCKSGTPGQWMQCIAGGFGTAGLGVIALPALSATPLGPFVVGAFCIFGLLQAIFTSPPVANPCPSA